MVTDKVAEGVQVGNKQLYSDNWDVASQEDRTGRAGAHSC